MATGYASGADTGNGHQAVAFDSKAFDSHFREHIAPHFERLEAQRQTLKSQYTWRLAIAAAGTFCAILVTALITLLMSGAGGIRTDDPEMFLFLPFLVGAGLFIWAQAPRRRYVRRYKERLLPAIAEYFGHFSYDADGGIRMSHLQQSTLVPSHDTYRHEDLFAGNYRDVDVEFCEARLTERRGSGKNRRTVVVFAGVFVLLTMNKNFKGKTVVRRDAGKLGNWLRGSFSGKLEPVKLEDPTFEKQFEVYSDDQVEARYLLTPAFMTRLMELCAALNTDQIEAAFFGAQLMIKLPQRKAASNTSVSIGGLNLWLGGSGGLFEPGSIFTSIGESGDINRIVNEFKSILSIVDLLKLYERTGL